MDAGHQQTLARWLCTEKPVARTSLTGVWPITHFNVRFTQVENELCYLFAASFQQCRHMSLALLFCKVQQSEKYASINKGMNNWSQLSIPISTDHRGQQTFVI